MTKFNAKRDTIKTTASQRTILKSLDSGIHSLYVGLDVHKDSIAVAIARPGRSEPEYRGEISNQPKLVKQLLQRLSQEVGDGILLVCYEAGPCGYILYRQIIALGHDCQVVAPSLIPRKPGERIKTDRRDALKLVKALRSGDLSAVWVPGQAQEAMRDLTRARGDMKSQERKARQQLNAFVLRHGHHWPGNRTRWTGMHYQWLELLTFEQPWQQVVLQEYILSARAATQRVVDLTDQMMRALPDWSLAPVVESLIAMRGIDKIAAMILLTELGDISRFESPRQLMAFLGLVPSEHSSGSRRRQGAITLTGNSHARRILVESAWSYRFPARMTRHLTRKALHASDDAKVIAWKAQKRLCGRYRRLTQSGKNTKLVCVAIARELIGFIWDIACHEMPKLQRPEA